MTLVQDHSHPHRGRFFVISSVAPSIAPAGSSLPPKSEFSEQSNGPLGLKFFAATIGVSKYVEDDLQQIFKAVLKAQALAPAPALVISKMPQEKLKARFPDIYRGKFHIDCYNFCQQYEDYFAITRATGPTQILFAASFL